jgi:hypothetical protein
MHSDCDVSVVLRVRDDEERIGRVAGRLATHLRQLGRPFELLIADEGSGDNTVAVAAVLRRAIPELRLMHCTLGAGVRAACEQARGRAVLVYDVAVEAAPAALSFTLERLRAGRDLVVVPGRYFVFRRTRAWRAFDALELSPSLSSFRPARAQRHALIECRFLRRARALELDCDVTHVRHRRFLSLRALFFSPRVA